MPERVHHHDELIYSVGTKVVTLRDIFGRSGLVLHPRGSVGVVLKAPSDLAHAYRVRFLDDHEEALHRDDIVMLARHKEGELSDAEVVESQNGLFERVIYRCVIGSRAYGLDDEDSDTDYRGIYLPRADAHWSLYGVPDQIDRDETQEQYWELQRFIVFALKANPNVLECLYTPLVEKVTPLALALLERRSMFLSKLVYQTFNGYVASQFKKMQADLRNQGQVKWKHVMHLIRLMISGIRVLKDGVVHVRVEEQREQLLAIKRGEVPWAETEKWRLQLHEEFDHALSTTKLPDRPDYRSANEFLMRARHEALGELLP